MRIRHHRKSKLTVFVKNPRPGGQSYMCWSTAESMVRRKHATWEDETQTSIVIASHALDSLLEAEKDFQFDQAIQSGRGGRVHFGWRKKMSGGAAVMQATLYVS